MGNVLGFTNQPFSIVAWVKTARGYSVSDSAVVSKHAAYSANGYWFMVNQASVGGQVGKAIFGEGTVAQSAYSTTSVNDGNWHQIVSTWQPGGIMVVYVDGAPPEAASNASATLNANSVAFLIGAVNMGGVPQARYTGLIDDVQIYNYALSDGDVNFLFQHPGQEAQSCSQQLAEVQAQLATATAANAVLQAQLATVNATNAALQARLAAAQATNAILSAQLAAANATIATLQAQLAAANNANAVLQAQLTACNNALAAANQTIQSLQTEIQDLVLPLQLLTLTFRDTFQDPQFQIRGTNTVEQMQNLIVEILDLPRGQQQELFQKLSGDKGKKAPAPKQAASPR
jgi:predicted  nucleic acid-binding Zn-ribbon protein